ncbi:type II toxin-antitoxin system Phd/YefM family antitoxin [Frankia sp. Cas3]|uniref:type II toxin-antitoxin system Phd/YefM family antitoxin n=1 Tax=Frankia sp. Cas3 TaxID=3073926 RepID=UPI003A10287C
MSEAKARLSELARRVRTQHERITLTRNGEAEAVLLSVDDLEGLEMTVEILSDSRAVARITESLAALGRGEEGPTSPLCVPTWPGGSWRRGGGDGRSRSSSASRDQRDQRDQDAGLTDSMLATENSRWALRRWHQASIHLP